MGLTGVLKSTEYEREFYEEHVAAGLDYAHSGHWQGQYGWMLVEIFDLHDGREFVLDVGCACGSVLYGIKRTTKFDRVKGVDFSHHMTQIGRDKLGFTEEELVQGSALKLPVKSKSVDLLHSQQMMEHIQKKDVPKVIKEFNRVLKPGGNAFICFCARQDHLSEESYWDDPSHITIENLDWWMAQFDKGGFAFDLHAYNKFVRNERKPGFDHGPNFFNKHFEWAAFMLSKR